MDSSQAGESPEWVHGYQEAIEHKVYSFNVYKKRFRNMMVRCQNLCMAKG